MRSVRAGAVPLARAACGVAVVAACTAATAVPAGSSVPGTVSAPPAAAGAWVADASNGTLTFRATQAGAEFEGRFTRFVARLQFVPGDRPAGRFDVTISTASVDTAERERDDLLRSTEFFDAARAPEARYLATAFARVGADAYEARGRLTLRGITRDVPLRFRWSGTTAGPILDGTATVRRLDFGIGQGEWRDTAWVGNDVRIAFALRPVPARAQGPT